MTGTLLAVDSGQTAIRGAVCDADGVVRSVGEVAVSSDPDQRVGDAALSGLVREVIDRALDGASLASIGAAAFGMTAVDDEADAVRVTELVRQVLPKPPLEILPDRVTCLTGATAGRPGAIVIAGGGSIGYGRSADGSTHILGGYGSRLGSDGSATDIGRRAVEAVIRAMEGRGPQTALTTTVTSALGVRTARDFVAILYGAAFSVRHFAELAPGVIAAADQGDPVAVGISAAVAEELAGLGLATLAAVGSDTSTGLHLVGGVFRTDRMRAAVQARVRAALPAVPVRTAPHAPLVGALMHAAMAAGLRPDEDWAALAESSLSHAQPHPSPMSEE